MFLRSIFCGNNCRGWGEIHPVTNMYRDTLLLNKYQTDLECEWIAGWYFFNDHLQIIRCIIDLLFGELWIFKLFCYLMRKYMFKELQNVKLTCNLYGIGIWKLFRDLLSFKTSGGVCFDLNNKWMCMNINVTANILSCPCYVWTRDFPCFLIFILVI